MPLTQTDSDQIRDHTINDGDISPTAAIDVSKLSSGLVSNAEFNRLSGVTAPIQGQIDSITGVSKGFVIAMSMALG